MIVGQVLRAYNQYNITTLPCIIMSVYGHGQMLKIVMLFVVIWLAFVSVYEDFLYLALCLCLHLLKIPQSAYIVLSFLFHLHLMGY